MTYISQSYSLDSAQSIYCSYSRELPHQGSSSGYPYKICFCVEMMKILVSTDKLPHQGDSSVYPKHVFLSRNNETSGIYLLNCLIKVISLRIHKMSFYVEIVKLMVSAYWNCLIKVISMSNHKMSFCVEIIKLLVSTYWNCLVNVILVSAHKMCLLCRNNGTSGIYLLELPH